MTSLWIYLGGLFLCVISLAAAKGGDIRQGKRSMVVWIVGMIVMLSSLFFLEGVL